MERLFIGGEYVESIGGGTIAVEDPATEEIIAAVPDASAEDVERAVYAARAAQPAWRRMDGLERAELMHRCADRLAEVKDDLAVLLTREGARVTPVRDLDEAIELANASELGLGASVYTSSLKAARADLRVGERVRVTCAAEGTYAFPGGREEGV